MLSRHDPDVGLGDGPGARVEGMPRAHPRTVPERDAQRIADELHDLRMSRSFRRHGDDHPLEQLHVVVLGEHTLVDQREVLLARDARGGEVGERRHARTLALPGGRRKWLRAYVVGGCFYETASGFAPNAVSLAGLYVGSVRGPGLGSGRPPGLGFGRPPEAHRGQLPRGEHAMHALPEPVLVEVELV